MANHIQDLYDKGVDYVVKGRGSLIAHESDHYGGNCSLWVDVNGEYYVLYTPANPALVSITRKPVVKGIAYIAGPMRGKESHNFPAFDAAADRLRKAGYFVFNPADFDRSMGLSEHTTDEDVTPTVLAGCLRRDLNAITKCTHVALLPGWEESRGVRPEAVLAYTLGETFILADDPAQRVPGDAVMAVIGGRLIGDYYAREGCGCNSGACEVPTAAE